MWLQWNAWRRADPHSEFAARAVEMHKRHIHGSLPLEMHSASPAIISAWFRGKVPFPVKLPSYDQMPAQHLPYQLEGAPLVSYENDKAADVAYRTGGTPVSLVALPASIAPLLRGRGVVMGKLTVFYDTLDAST